MLKRPLKKIRQEDGSVSLENLMRMHRFVIQRDSKRYILETKEHWPKEKLPKLEFYSREFMEVMMNNEDNILNRLGLDNERIDAIKRKSWALGKNSLSSTEVQSIIRTMKWALKDHPLSKRILGKNEFEEETRSRNEVIADAFLDMNKKRFSQPLGSKEPFSDRLINAILDPAFLDVCGLTPEVEKSLLDLKTKEVSAMTAREKDSISTAIGRALYNCPFVKDRIGHLGEKNPKRNFVSPQSSMKEIMRELRIEAGEVYEDRRPEKGEKKGLKGTMYSEDLLRTVFDDSILEKIGITITEEKIDMNAEGYEFLRSEYNLEKPLLDKNGIGYPSVENAYQSMRTEDIELKKKIAASEPTSAWKLVSDLPNPETLRPMRSALTKKKFKENPDLLEKLLRTGTREIVGPGGITLMKIRNEEFRKRGGLVANNTWLASWKKQVETHPGEGELSEYLKTLNEKQKDSLHMCVGSTIKNAFKRYKETHPEEFPQFTPPPRVR